MKKLLIVSALAVTSSAMAMDTKMNLAGRFNYLSDSVETNGAQKNTNGNYVMDYLKWGNSLKFNETTTAQLDLDFTRNVSSDVTTRSMNNLIDVAAVTKSFGHGISAIIGKQAIITGGRENDHSKRDNYLTSLHNTQSNAGIPDNQIGLTAQYEIAEQTFSFQHLENAGTSTYKDKKVRGIAYNGNFLNNMISPIISYHKIGTDSVGGNDTLTDLGFKFTFGTFLLETDYLMLKQHSSNTDKKLNSVVAHVKYNHENYKPFVKYIMETGKDGYQMDSTHLGAGVAKSQRNAWEVGFEYVPNKDEDMRYHVVYNSSEMKEKTGGTDKFKENKIIAGLAFGMNILK